MALEVGSEAMDRRGEIIDADRSVMPAVAVYGISTSRDDLLVPDDLGLMLGQRRRDLGRAR